MPWLSIIMALLSFFTSQKSNGGNTARSAAVGAIAGLGTYYVTHNTEWGSTNLGQFDGVVTPPTVAPDGSTVGGAPAVSANGVSVPTSAPATAGSTSGLWSTLSSWGPTGTAAVLGVAGAATGVFSFEKMLPWIIGGVTLFLLAK